MRSGSTAAVMTYASRPRRKTGTRTGNAGLDEPGSSRPTVGAPVRIARSRLAGSMTRESVDPKGTIVLKSSRPLPSVSTTAVHSGCAATSLRASS